WQMEGDDISLLVGGPDGLAPACLDRAAERWSLSALTLPHPLVRVLIAEQVYRAWGINHNHPYHRSSRARTYRMQQRIPLKDPYHELRIFRMRMVLAVLVMLVLFGVLIGRYFHLQVVEYERYRTESDRNRVQLLPVAPRRGLIFDRSGELLADNLASFSLDIVKERVDNLDDTIKRLRALVDIDDRDVEKFHRRLRDRR